MTKQEFLSKFYLFNGNDDDGYEYPSVSFDSDEIEELSGGQIDDLEMLEGVLNNPDDNEEVLLDLHNSIMDRIFGEGESFQGSFEEEMGSGEYCWYLDFGTISIDEEYKIKYSGVRFYRG